MLRRLSCIALLAAFLLASLPMHARASDLVVLNIPYRTQLDGSPYAGANCGPASLAMVLNGFGQAVSVEDIRAQVNDLQGTWGDYDSGTAIENLGLIAERYGVESLDLMADGGLRRWTLDEVRAHLAAGHPVIPQVWYPGLPGRENARYRGDHFIVLTGFVGSEFFFHDPINDVPGAHRRMSEEQLLLSWTNGDLPFAALAFTSPAGLAALQTVSNEVAPPPPPAPTQTPTATAAPTATATPYPMAEPIQSALPTATPTPLARPAPASLPSQRQAHPLAAWLSEWVVTTALSFTLPGRR